MMPFQTARLSALELCVGAGGLALAAAQAGFSKTTAVDVHGRACETLRKNKATGVKHVKDWTIIEADIRHIDFKAHDGALKSRTYAKHRSSPHDSTEWASPAVCPSATTQWVKAGSETIGRLRLALLLVFLPLRLLFNRILRSAELYHVGHVFSEACGSRLFGSFLRHSRDSIVGHANL